MAGRLLVDMIEQSSRKVAKAIASSPRWRKNAKRTAHTRALEQASEDANELKKTFPVIIGQLDRGITDSLKSEKEYKATQHNSQSLVN